MGKKQKLSWATVDVGRACIAANGNLVVAYEGKKSFWSYEGLVLLANQCPQALTLPAFCACVEKEGEPCENKKTGVCFMFVARDVPEEEALQDVEEN